MAWLKSKSVLNNINNIEELKKNLLTNPHGILPELWKALKQQDFSGCWIVLKEVLPLLDKNKARDTVRLLFTDHVPELVALVEDRKEREMAVECLGYLASRDVIEVLVKLLNHKDDTVQLIASGALQKHTPRLVTPLLVEGLLKEELPPARAGEVLLSMGFLAQEMMMEAYPRAPVQVQVRLLELMVLGDNPKCLPYVGKALESQEPQLQKKALDAVKHFAFEELWMEVAMCLAEEDWTIRAKALQVLAELGIGDALEFAEPFLGDEDSWVRQCAADCVRKLRYCAGKKGGE